MGTKHTENTDMQKDLLKLAYELGYAQAVKQAAADPLSPGKETVGEWWDKAKDDVMDWTGKQYGKFKGTAPGQWFDEALVSGPNAQRNRTYAGTSGVGALAGYGIAKMLGGNKTLGALLGAGLSPLALWLLVNHGSKFLKTK